MRLGVQTSTVKFVIITFGKAEHTAYSNFLWQAIHRTERRLGPLHLASERDQVSPAIAMVRRYSGVGVIPYLPTKFSFRTTVQLTYYYI